MASGWPDAASNLFNSSLWAGSEGGATKKPFHLPVGSRSLIPYLGYRELQRMSHHETEGHGPVVERTLGGRGRVALDQRPSTRCRKRSVELGRWPYQIDHRRCAGVYVGKRVWQGGVVAPWGSVRLRTSSRELGSATRLESWIFESGWPGWPGRLLFIFSARHISHPGLKQCSQSRVES